MLEKSIASGQDKNRRHLNSPPSAFEPNRGAWAFSALAAGLAPAKPEALTSSPMRLHAHLRGVSLLYDIRHNSCCGPARRRGRVFSGFEIPQRQHQARNSDSQIIRYLLTRSGGIRTRACLSSASDMSASRASPTCADHPSFKPNCGAWAVCTRAAPRCQGYFPNILEFIHSSVSSATSFGFSRLRGRVRNFISFYFLDSRLFLPYFPQV